MTSRTDIGLDDVTASPDTLEQSLFALQATRGETFEGDTGTLPLDTRRVMVQLLGGPLVDGRRQAKVWEVLVRDEKVLRSRLHELFLELVVDREQQVAFLRQVVRDSVDIPILLRRNTLSFIETALLLFLRLRLTQADSQGERAVLDTQEMMEHLKAFERSDNVDQIRFTRQCEAALEKAKKLGLLRKLANSGERMEVSPALKLLFPAEEVEQLVKVYALASGEAAPAEPGAPMVPAVDDDNDEQDDAGAADSSN